VNTGLLLTAWHDLLSGLNVHKIDVPEDETENYVWIYIESGSSSNLKTVKVDEVIVVCQIVTFHQNNIDQTACEALDAQVENLVLPLAWAQSLSVSGMQVLNVERESFDYVQEEDSNGKIYRKVSRYKHTINQS
jgi:hypothetical protein